MKNIINKYKYFIFDFDKTIATVDIDWSKWHFGAGNIYKKFEPNFNDHLKGKKVFHLQNDMYVKYGSELKLEMDKYTRDFEKNETHGFIPVQKTIDLIRLLNDNNKKLYVWSSNDLATIKKGLIDLQLEKYFEKIVSRDMVDLLKPYDDGFIKYFKGLGGELEEYLMIGDSDSDRMAAENSGIDYLNVTEINSNE